MANYGTGLPPEKETRDPYATRRQRRNAFTLLIKQLRAIADAEKRYIDNIPENLQSSVRYEEAEQTVTAIDEALDILSDAF